MAVQIRVLKGGKLVSGVSVFYRKKSSGLTGEKTTDDQGRVSFHIDPVTDSGQAQLRCIFIKQKPRK